MAFIHAGSCECASSERVCSRLAPRMQTSIERGIQTDYLPISSTTSGTLIEIDVTNNGDDNLTNSFFHVSENNEG